MPLRDLRSRRLRESAMAAGDALEYEVINPALRTQILNLLRAAIGGWGERNPWDTWSRLPKSNAIWDFLDKALADEFGAVRLGPNSNGLQNFWDFFQATPDVDHVLDCVELAFRAIDRTVRDWMTEDKQLASISLSADEAISRLNSRFLDHQVGYQYVNGEVVRVDNQLAYQEITAKAIALLSDPTFSGPNQEFMVALGHLRSGRSEDSITWAEKAFESTMKALCERRGWRFKATDAAKQLIGVMLTNQLVPSALQTQFTSFAQLLESGAPTVRNKFGGHGQGAVPVAVPEYLATYAVNLAASNIILLISAEAALP
jgi:AbiJ N-terminal domain 4